MMILDQSVVLCDAEYASILTPMDYDPRRLKIEEDHSTTRKKKNMNIGVKYNGDGNFGGAAEAVPDTPPTETEEDPPCPGPNAPRIGDVAQNKIEKVSGFELQVDPRNPDGVKICVVLYEDIGAAEQFLPAPQVAATTAAIAVVATSSALLAKPLADLLLKVVKPAVKKDDCEGSEVDGEETSCTFFGSKKVEAEGSECWCEGCPSVEGLVVFVSSLNIGLGKS